MAIIICQSFTLDNLQGVHDFSSDTIKAALYDAGLANFSSDTTAYTATDEVASGNGYTTGGNTMTPSSGYPQVEGEGSAVRFDTLAFTFTAEKTFRWALIYNSSKSNKAIMAIDLGRSVSVLGTFNFRFPVSTNPLIWHKAPYVAGA